MLPNISSFPKKSIHNTAYRHPNSSPTSDNLRLPSIRGTKNVKEGDERNRLKNILKEYDYSLELCTLKKGESLETKINALVVKASENLFKINKKRKQCFKKIIYEILTKALKYFEKKIGCNYKLLPKRNKSLILFTNNKSDRERFKKILNTYIYISFTKKFSKTINNLFFITDNILKENKGIKLKKDFKSIRDDFINSIAIDLIKKEGIF